MNKALLFLAILLGMNIAVHDRINMDTSTTQSNYPVSLRGYIFAGLNLAIEQRQKDLV